MYIVQYTIMLPTGVWVQSRGTGMDKYIKIFIRITSDNELFRYTT